MSAYHPPLAEVFEGAAGPWRYHKAKRFVEFMYRRWGDGDMSIILENCRFGYNHSFWLAVTDEYNLRSVLEADPPGRLTVELILDLIEFIEKVKA